MSESGNWMSKDLVDMKGKSFLVGDMVVRAKKSGQAINIEVCEVTQIKNGKIYLDGSSVPINFPGRLLIVTKLYE